MAYVDGFVLPVPRDNVAAYRRIARKAGKVWLEYGALEYIDDVVVKAPKDKRANSSLVFATNEGALVLNDPAQGELEIGDVKSVARDDKVRSVAAA